MGGTAPPSLLSSSSWYTTPKRSRSNPVPTLTEFGGANTSQPPPPRTELLLYHEEGRERAHSPSDSIYGQMQSWRAVRGLDRSQPLIHPFFKDITRLPPVDDNCTRATYMSLFQKLVATATRRFWHKEIVKEATAEPREIAVKHKLRAFYFTCTLK